MIFLIKEGIGGNHRIPEEKEIWKQEKEGNWEVPDLWVLCIWMAKISTKQLRLCGFSQMVDISGADIGYLYKLSGLY